jgi:mannose-6-phosphate isomerase-like protein (cupin superfamily)
MTRLRVYEERPAPDGALSGCAHVHALTDEAYYVVAGSGALELSDPGRGFRTVPLSPGAYVHFAAGTLHRVVSHGGLDVLVVMGNAGLAERGDARIYFGEEVDADPDAFARLVALPGEKGLEGALQRRDRSVEAYTRLLALWESDRAAWEADVRRFVSLHAEAMAGRRKEFAGTVATGPGAALSLVQRRLSALPAPLPPDPARVDRPEPSPGHLGMCGHLWPVLATTDL